MFVLAQQVLLALQELLGDGPVCLGCFSFGVVVVTGSVEHCIAVLPHVPCRCHQLVDDGHCPAKAGLLGVLLAVVGILVIGYALSHSSQLKVVPADVVLVVQGPSQWVGQVGSFYIWG